MNFQFLKITFFCLGILFLFVPFIVRAAVIEFNIDPSYDYLAGTAEGGRSKITAFLHQLGNNADFFVEESYYQNLDIEKRKEFSQSVKSLIQEFDEVIYPKLREIYGSEWKPGIDKKDEITVLLARIKGEAGGYFNQGDEYPKAQVPASNEREMIYLNVDYIGSQLIKSFLAHEFLHLITFNQKEKIRGVSEEIWLNEARAEAAITLLGYDDEYKDSNLQRRVKAFSQKPKDSLTEWKNESFDYGAANLFAQYLLDHYGKKILSDSMNTEKTGILSLQEALKKNGYSQDFPQIFSDWMMAVLVNDCGIGPKYCYLNQNLKNLKILPQLNYLPLAEESTLTITDKTKNWSGNWLKFIGAEGTLKIEFIGDSRVDFKVPYLIQSSEGGYSISQLDLNAGRRGTVYISNFGKKYDSLIIMPFIKEKISGFDGLESFYQFILSASIINPEPERVVREGPATTTVNKTTIEDLKAEINRITALVFQLQAQLAEVLTKSPERGIPANFSFSQNLNYGQVSTDIKYLQIILNSDADTKVASSGAGSPGSETTYFGPLTKAAVVKFQEKYAADILTPLGLTAGTGFVGSQTRAKLNKLLG